MRTFVMFAVVFLMAVGLLQAQDAEDPNQVSVDPAVLIVETSALAANEIQFGPLAQTPSVVNYCKATEAALEEPGSADSTLEGDSEDGADDSVAEISTEPAAAERVVQAPYDPVEEKLDREYQEIVLMQRAMRHDAEMLLSLLREPPEAAVPAVVVPEKDFGPAEPNRTIDLKQAPYPWYHRLLIVLRWEQATLTSDLPPSERAMKARDAIFEIGYKVSGGNVDWAAVCSAPSQRFPVPNKWCEVANEVIIVDRIEYQFRHGIILAYFLFITAIAWSVRFDRRTGFLYRVPWGPRKYRLLKKLLS